MKKNTYWSVIILVALALVLIMVTRQMLRRPGGDVLVKVGDRVITTQTFREEWNRQYSAPGGIPPENVEELLNDVVTEKLFLIEAASQKLDRDPRFEREVENYREQLLVEMFLDREVLSIPPPTQKEIEDYWAKNSKLFSVPELVRVSHILVKPKEGEEDAAARQRCQKSVDRLADGEDFSRLAQDSSEGSSAARGGDLGYFRQGQLSPELEEEAWKLEVGKIAGPVKTEYGYHIIKVTDKKAPRDKILSEAKEEVAAAIQSLRRKEKFEALEARLRGKTFIEKSEEALRALKAELERKPLSWGRPSLNPTTKPTSLP